MCDGHVPNHADVFTVTYRNAPKTAPERVFERHLLRAGWAEKQDVSTPRGMRQYNCGWAPVGNAGLTGIRRSEQGQYAYAYGVQHCGYKSCPTCAVKLAEARRQEIHTAMATHTEKGGGVYAMLLTAPHTSRQGLESVQDMLQKAWTQTTRSDGPYKAAKAHYGIQDWIRCEEILHTKNGWHVHYHVLLFTESELPETEREVLGEWFFGRWADMLEKNGAGSCDRRGFGIEAIRSPGAISRYLSGSESVKNDRAKAVSLEMARGDLKKDRRAYLMGKRLPFEILADALEMDERHDWALYREYTEAMHNHMTIRWSNGAKKRLGVTEKSDEQILAEERAYDEERPLTPEELNLVNGATIPGRPRHSGMDYLTERVGRYGMQEVDLFLDFQRMIQAMQRSP